MAFSLKFGDRPVHEGREVGRILPSSRIGGVRHEDVRAEPVDGGAARNERDRLTADRHVLLHLPIRRHRDSEPGGMIDQDE